MFFFVICPMDFSPRVEFELQKDDGKNPDAAAIGPHGPGCAVDRH
jgi:hypothetical protein